MQCDQGSTWHLTFTSTSTTFCSSSSCIHLRVFIKTRHVLLRAARANSVVQTHGSFPSLQTHSRSSTPFAQSRSQTRMLRVCEGTELHVGPFSKQGPETTRRGNLKSGTSYGDIIHLECCHICRHNVYFVPLQYEIKSKPLDPASKSNIRARPRFQRFFKFFLHIRSYMCVHLCRCPCLCLCLCVRVRVCAFVMAPWTCETKLASTACSRPLLPQVMKPQR